MPIVTIWSVFQNQVTYRIMQIIRGGRLSRLQRLIEIHGKTFAVVSFMQYLLTSLMKLLLENFHGG